MFLEETGLKFDVAGLVHTMDVSKASGNGEVRRNLRKGMVHIPDILRLSVQTRIIHTCIVNT